jgi:hypothetical protein
MPKSGQKRLLNYLGRKPASSVADFRHVLRLLHDVTNPAEIKYGPRLIDQSLVLLADEYVAQSYAAPGTRGVPIDATRAELKVDVRLYTFAGSILLGAAAPLLGADNQHAHGGRRVRSVAGGSYAARESVMSAAIKLVCCLQQASRR